jgi:hypothetical protein
MAQRGKPFWLVAWLVSLSRRHVTHSTQSEGHDSQLLPSVRASCDTVSLFLSSYIPFNPRYLMSHFLIQASWEQPDQNFEAGDSLSVPCG